MDLKFCTECGTKNVSTAKFCFGCGLCFATLGESIVAKQVAATPPPAKTQPPVNKKQKQVYVFKDEENENLQDEDDDSGDGKMYVEVDQEFTNDFANLVIAKGGGAPNKGIKFGEIVNTAKPTENRKTLIKRKNTGPKTVKDILSQGKNSKRGQQSED